MFVGVADASTLGWANMMTSILGEIKAIAVIALVIAVLIMAISIAYRRHLQDLGENMTALGTSAGMISAVIAGGSGLFGLAAAAPLTDVLQAPLTNAVWGFALGDLAWGSVALGLPFVGYLRWRRAARR